MGPHHQHHYQQNDHWQRGKPAQLTASDFLRRRGKQRSGDHTHQSTKYNRQQQQQNDGHQQMIGCQPGGDGHKFTEENIERGHSAQCQCAAAKQDSGKRHDFQHAAHHVQIAGAVFQQHVAGTAEQQCFGQTVVHRMQQGGENTQRAADTKRHRHQPHVFHTGVGKQTFHILLDKDKERRHCDREQAKDHQQRIGERAADGVADDDVIANQHQQCAVQQHR